MKSVRLSDQDRARLRRSHDALAARAVAHKAAHGEDNDFEALTALADWALSAPVAVIDMEEALRPFGGMEAQMCDRTPPAVAYFMGHRKEIDGLFGRPMTNLIVKTPVGVLHQLVSGMMPAGQVITTLMTDDDDGTDFLSSVHLDTSGPKVDIRSAVYNLSSGEQLPMSEEEVYENTGRLLGVYMAAANFIHRVAVEICEAESGTVH